MGRFTIAAKHHQTVAELFEDNVAHMETVIQHYQIAADYFKGEESTSSANKCLVKVAQYTATMEKYEKAIQIYEQVSAGQKKRYSQALLSLVELLHYCALIG